ncbi:MAG: PqqD family protein [Vulcanimicrobiota bacterium]
MSDRFLWRIVNGEALVVDLSNGDYYSLNPTGTEILRRMTEGEGADQVAAYLEDRFGRAVGEEVADFFRQLQHEQLDGLAGDSTQALELAQYAPPVLRKYSQLDSLAAYSPDKL